MSNHFNNLSLPLQKVIDLGEIDRWLRGVAELVPLSAETAQGSAQSRESCTDAYEVTAHDFNTHALYYGNSHLISGGDIERMVGFRQLLAAASQRNIRLDVSDHGGGHLEVSFTPDEPFRASRIFGASYANVLPVIFTHGRGSRQSL